MRHRVKGKKLNRHSQSRKALLRELSKGLLEHGKIETTLVKAKYVRPHVERLITVSLKNDLSARRRLIAELQDKELADKVLSEVGPMYKDFNGGYTRIRRTTVRKGDATQLAELSLVEVKVKKDESAKEVKAEKAPKAETKKPAKKATAEKSAKAEKVDSKEESK